jgi:hypothetical protein
VGSILFVVESDLGIMKLGIVEFLLKVIEHAMKATALLLLSRV